MKLIIKRKWMYCIKTEDEFNPGFIAGNVYYGFVRNDRFLTYCDEQGEQNGWNLKFFKDISDLEVVEMEIKKEIYGKI